MLPESVTELGPAVAVHTVGVALAVVLLHGTPGVSLTAGSEILPISGEDGSDVRVSEARPRKTRCLVSGGGSLELDQHQVLASSLPVPCLITVVVRVEGSAKIWSVEFS